MNGYNYIKRLKHKLSPIFVVVAAVFVFALLLSSVSFISTPHSIKIGSVWVSAPQETADKVWVRNRDRCDDKITLIFRYVYALPGYESAHRDVNERCAIVCRCFWGINKITGKYMHKQNVSTRWFRIYIIFIYSHKFVRKNDVCVLCLRALLFARRIQHLRELKIYWFYSSCLVRSNHWKEWAELHRRSVEKVGKNTFLRFDSSCFLLRFLFPQTDI